MKLAWSEGGKEQFLTGREITMTHDELAAALGEAYKTITDAGFVLVPKTWRDNVLRRLA